MQLGTISGRVAIVNSADDRTFEEWHGIWQTVVFWLIDNEGVSWDEAVERWQATVATRHWPAATIHEHC